MPNSTEVTIKSDYGTIEAVIAIEGGFLTDEQRTEALRKSVAAAAKCFGDASNQIVELVREGDLIGSYTHKAEMQIEGATVSIAAVATFACPSSFMVHGVARATAELQMRVAAAVSSFDTAVYMQRMQSGVPFGAPGVPAGPAPTAVIVNDGAGIGQYL